MANVVTTEVVVIGAGPTGLASAMYSARDRYDTVVLEKLVPGGQINNTDRIENYPGFKMVSGADMAMAQYEQAISFGAKIKTGAAATGILRLDDGMLEVSTTEDTYLTKVVILAPGSDFRKLGIPGEEKFRSAGSGVSYCGMCDAPFFKDKVVVTVGGGNTAVEDTIHLSRFASKVIMVHRRDEFRATKVLIEELLEEEKKGIIDIRYDSVLTSINGSQSVDGVTLKNVKTQATEEVGCDGVFIFIGHVPNTGFLNGILTLTEQGFVTCDPKYLRTEIPGVFVAGDCRVGAAMQLATATGDGVAVAVYMKEYLRDPQWWTTG